MSWEQFIYFAIAAILLWAIGAWAAWKEKTGIAYTATIVGLVVFFSFILSMWISMERPPLRTMGETRLWYSFFLPLAGYHCLFAMEIQMDTHVFHDSCLGVHLREPVQA